MRVGTILTGALLSGLLLAGPVPAVDAQDRGDHGPRRAHAEPKKERALAREPRASQRPATQPRQVDRPRAQARQAPARGTQRPRASGDRGPAQLREPPRVATQRVPVRARDVRARGDRQAAPQASAHAAQPRQAAGYRGAVRQGGAATGRAHKQQSVAKHDRTARERTRQRQDAQVQRRAAELRERSTLRRPASSQARANGERQRPRMNRQERNLGRVGEKRHDRGVAHGRARVSEAERQRRIAEQRRRNDEYSRMVAARRVAQRGRYRALQQQRRQQQYRYQQDYYRRLHGQQLRWDALRPGYDRDPYYWTPASYRYYRDGRYHEVNRYAADLLRQAIRYGYQEGARAGRADRLDGWRYDVSNAYGYRDADYGYNGRYLGLPEYRYYFRQGFRRGYEDGYGSRYRYGTQVDGTPLILQAVLAAILDLQAL